MTATARILATYRATHFAERGAQRGAPHGAARASDPAAVAAGAPSAPCPPALPGEHGDRMPRRPAAMAPLHGAAVGAPHGAPYDAATVLARLEEAGRSLLALPNTGFSPRLRISALDIVRSALAGDTLGGEAGGRLRPPPPDNAQVSRMDEAFAWLQRIPQERYVLRRIVGTRALVSPATDRHVYSWRKLATLLGADHKAIQRWHAQGIALIVAALNTHAPRHPASKM